MRARDVFRQEINQINTARASLGLNKAQAQLTALQDYNQRKRNLEDYYMQQQSSLEQYQRQLKDTRDTWMMQTNYTNSLNQANNPTFSANQTNFRGYGYGNDASRGAVINQLMGTSAGQRQLQNLGYDIYGDYIQNRNSGETYDRFGLRYKDWGIRDQKQKNLERVPTGQNE
jgi:hypothetical protein